MKDEAHNRNKNQTCLEEVRIAYNLKYENYILMSKEAEPKSISPIPLAEQSQAFVVTLYLYVGTFLLYTELRR